MDENAKRTLLLIEFLLMGYKVKLRGGPWDKWVIQLTTYGKELSYTEPLGMERIFDNQSMLQYQAITRYIDTDCPELWASIVIAISNNKNPELWLKL